MSILVIHQKKHISRKGHRVYIGRPSSWGNPFASKPSKVGERISLEEWQAKPDPWDWLVANMGKYTIRTHSPEQSVELYSQLLRKLWQLSSTMRSELLELARAAKYGDQDLLLCCWCKHAIGDNTPCHGDPLKAALEGIITKGLV